MLYSFVYGADVVQGDCQDPQQTFNQSISVFDIDRLGDFFYVGSSTAGAQSYALAYLPRGASKFEPLSPQMVDIDGVFGENPLYNASIRLLSLLSRDYRPVVVSNNDPSKLYFIPSFSNAEKIEMLVTSDIITSELLATSGIIGLTANNTDDGGYIFVTVKNNNGDPFGQVGSGIALVAAHFIKKDNVSHFGLNQLSITPFDRINTSQIQIESPVTFLGTDIVDMCWDNYLGRLYIALQLQAGTNVTDGVKALVVGQLKNVGTAENQRLAITFNAIGPDNVFQGNNKVVGTIGAQEQVSLHKVRAMLTSTSLQYVIVLGGNGTPANTKRSVFALPVVNNHYGRIKAWTDWKRVSGSVEDKVFGAVLEPPTANMILLTGDDQNSINTVKRTTWGNGDNEGLGPLGIVFGEAFPCNRGGIHGLFDMPLSTTGLNDISLLVATGCQTVSLAQTSTSNGGFEPMVGNIFETNRQLFSNGIIDQALPTGANALCVLTISGGALNNLGFINAAEIASAGGSAWLFVGGAGGLAVLTRDDGIGWEDPPGLGQGFSGLHVGTKFKLIGSYKNVRKLVYDDNFLYVLTDIKLDRIDLVNSAFSTGDLVVTTVAAVGLMPGVSNYSTFFDVIISNKFALLATTDGLFRIANGKDIRSAHSGDWSKITIPEGSGPVIQLFAISKTGKEQDSACFDGGNIYALVAFIGKNRAQANRFSTQSVDRAEITDETIQPLPDLFVQNIPSYFVSFGQFRDWIVSDGALFLHEINRNLCEDPVIYALRVARSGIRFLADKNPALPLTLHDACFLLPVLRNSATGSWLLAGNDGLRINE